MKEELDTYEEMCYMGAMVIIALIFLALGRIIGFFIFLAIILYLVWRRRRE